MLQGSSSAAPIYNISTDVSLATYNRLAHGAVFQHAITVENITDRTTQYVDDKTEMINSKGIQHNAPRNPNQTFIRESLFRAGTENTKIQTSLLWLSGGNLNPSKCFYYYIHPRYNFKRLTTEYVREKRAPGNILITDPVTKVSSPIDRLEPSQARRTLGVTMAPSGTSKEQINVSLGKAQKFLGKIKHSKLSKKAKWTAITSIMEPEVH